MVQHPEDQAKVRQLLTQLDPGEAEAIALATERSPDYLLIDEAKGRQIARGAGLPVIGILGVLLLAKERSLIPAIQPLMDDLQRKARFFIRATLYDELLRLANENE